MMKFLSLLTALCIFQSVQAKTNVSSTDSIAVATTINDFLDAFRNLDFEKFRSYFAEDANVFFPPSAKVNTRVNGKENVEQVFKTFFDKVRTQKASAPYLEIEPEHLLIEIFENTAVVTFELEEKGLLDRRTIILEKKDKQWLIEHIHASNIETNK